MAASRATGTKVKGMPADHRATAPAMSRIGWREDEYRFGMVELARNRLHRIRLEALGLAHHRERITGKAAVGEHVERGKRPVHGSVL